MAIPRYSCVSGITRETQDVQAWHGKERMGKSLFIPNGIHQALFYPDTHVSHPVPSGSHPVYMPAGVERGLVLEVARLFIPNNAMTLKCKAFFPHLVYDRHIWIFDQLDAPQYDLSSSLSFLLSQPQVPTLITYDALSTWVFHSLSTTNTGRQFRANGTCAMCNVTKNYYIYEQCQDPSVHFVGTSMDEGDTPPCPAGPHERYIVQPGICPLCHG